MIQAVKLTVDKGVVDLTLNAIYEAEVHSPSLVKLTKTLLGQLKQQCPLKTGTKVAVRLTKITLPHHLELEVISESYDVVAPKHTFLIKSATLQKMEQQFSEAADLIKQAICNGDPILIRHHADCDGYVAAIALEKAITPLIQKKNQTSIWRYLRRLPSRVPYYDYSDALKDLHLVHKDLQMGKSPLIILADKGSTDQSLLALKKLRLYNMQVLIIDHHQPSFSNGVPIVGSYANVFINPHLVGADYNLTAGMLGVELGLIIKNTENIAHMAAIAGFADKSQGDEFEQYKALAVSRGYTPEVLDAIAQAVDFEAFYLGFTESRIMEDLLTDKIEPTKQRVAPLTSEIACRKEALLRAITKYATKTCFKDFDLVKLKVFDFYLKGDYPPPGKLVGIAFDSFKANNKPVVVLGIGRGFITIRSNYTKFSINTLLEEMAQSIDHALIGGGGHEVAGTLQYAEAAEAEILAYIEHHLTNELA
ncbi:MAG: DHH family phosphoesterase [Candidatus Woesearchaeota archaeon]